jgi:hypothetical protein
MCKAARAPTRTPNALTMYIARFNQSLRVNKAIAAKANQTSPCLSGIGAEIAGYLVLN